MPEITENNLSNINIFPAMDFTHEQWLAYYNMMQENDRKFEPETYNKDLTLQEMKDEWLVFHDTYLHRSYEKYGLFEKNICAGWTAFMLDSRSSVFNFGSAGEIVPDKHLKVILKLVYDYMCRHNLSVIYYYGFSDRNNNALKKINCPVFQEMIDSKIDRKDMDTAFYNNIISSANLEKYQLVFYEEVPDELMDNFTLLMNDILDDYRTLNPVKTDSRPVEKKDWIRKMKAEKDSGAKMQMYMLLTTSNDIAAYCSLYIDSRNKNAIRHNGGFTAVSRAHRGKGFAAFLKAKIYLKLLEENNDFKYVVTDTMPWNTYMYRINQRFGFKPFSYGYEFRLTKQFIENYLNNIE